jgi:hypothetical protein
MLSTELYFRLKNLCACFSIDVGRYQPPAGVLLQKRSPVPNE